MRRPVLFLSVAALALLGRVQQQTRRQSRREHPERQRP